MNQWTKHALPAVGEPFPLKKINPFQRRRTIPEDQHHAQAIGRYDINA